MKPTDHRLGSSLALGIALLLTSSPGATRLFAQERETDSARNIVNLKISPNEDFTLSENNDGDFAEEKVYILENTGSALINWSCSGNQPWFSAIPESGTIRPGNSARITVAFTEAATELATNVSAYVGSLTINNLSQGGNESHAVRLTVAAHSSNLTKSATALEFQNTVGVSTTSPLTLSNTAPGGSQNLTYTVTPSTDSGGNWLSVDDNSETLAPGGSKLITVTANAAGIPDGSYLTGKLRITSNDPEHASVDVPVELAVGNFVRYNHTELPNTNNTANPYDVCAQVFATDGLNTGSVKVFYNTSGGTFFNNPMVPGENNTYCGTIPAQPAGMTVFYYLQATDMMGRVETYPKNAPIDALSFQVGYPQLVVNQIESLEIQVEPKSFNALNHVLTIRNAGTGFFNWSITESNSTGGSSLFLMTLSPITGTLGPNELVKVYGWSDTGTQLDGVIEKGSIKVAASGNPDVVIPVSVEINNTKGSSRHGFPFDGNSNGWTYLTVPAFFTEPNGFYTSGALRTRATDTTGNFGFWESSTLQFVGPGQEPAAGNAPVQGPTGKESLYLLKTNMASNQADPKTASQFRTRFTASDFQQSDLLISESEGNARMSPGLIPKTYYQFFSPALGTRQFHEDFDFLNVSYRDDPTGFIDLYGTSLEVFDRAGLTDMTQGPTLDFRGGQSNGWVVRTAEPFLPGPDIFEATNQGLLIRGMNTNPGNANLPEFTFGYWESPNLSEQGMTLVGGRLYEFTFTCTSEGTPAARDQVPGIRLRMNLSTFEAAVYQEVGSVGNLDRTVVAGESKQYTIYFYCPPELNGATLTAAFDFYLSKYSNDNITIGMILETLSIKSYAVEL